MTALASNPGFPFQILYCSFGGNLEWKVWVRGYDNVTKVWHNASFTYLCPKFQYTLEVS